MVTYKRRQSRFLALVVATVAFVLTACRIDATVEVHTDGSVKTAMVFEDTDDTLTSLNRKCDNLKNRAALVGRFAEATMEDITPPGGHLTCKAELNKPLYDDVRVETGRNTYSLIFPPSTLEVAEGDYIKLTITVIMPGKVIKTNMGTINGNKVTVKGFNYIKEGISITSEKGDSATSPSVSPSSSAKETSLAPSTQKNGLPLWVWLVIGVGSAVAIVGIAAVAASKRRRFPKRNV